MSRSAISEAFHTRLESMIALEGAYPEYEDIIHHNMDHKYDVVTPIFALNGGEATDLVKRKQDNHLCVRKTFMIYTKAKPRRWLREVKAVRVLSHPNVEGYIEAAVSPSRAELFLEYCDLGSLTHFKSYMVSNNIHIPENFIWHVFKGLFKGLCHMHYGFDKESQMLDDDFPENTKWNPIMHRDIKLGHVYLKSPEGEGEYPVVKLANFWMGMSKKDLKMPFLTSGSEGWMTPEYPNCSTRGDVYSATAVIQCLTMPDWTEADPEGGVGPDYSSDLNDCVLEGMIRLKANRPRARELTQMLYGVEREEFGLIQNVPDEAFRRLLPVQPKAE